MNFLHRALCIAIMAAFTFFASADPSYAEQPLFAIVQGTLVNVSGVPVADVEVSCWWYSAPMFEPPTFTRGGDTHSGADGRFALMCPHPMGSLDPAVPTGMLLGFVVTRHPDYGITVTPWQRVGAGLYRGATQLSEVPLELMPPRTASPIILPVLAYTPAATRNPPRSVSRSSSFRPGRSRKHTMIFVQNPIMGTSPVPECNGAGNPGTGPLVKIRIFCGQGLCALKPNLT